jgi:hypothetical protein
VRRFDLHVAMYDRRLETQDVIADAANGFQEFGRCSGVGGNQVLTRHAERIGRELGRVELERVAKHGIEPLCADIGTDPFHHFGGGHGRAEYFERFLPTGIANYIAARRQLGAQLRDGCLAIGLPSVNTLDFEGHGCTLAFPG